MTTEAVVIQIVGQLPNVSSSSIEPDSDLFTEIDLDSLAMLDLVSQVEGYFEIKLFPQGLNVQMYVLKTPKSLATHIDELLAQRNSAS